MSEKEIRDQKNYLKSSEKQVKNILKDFEFIEIFNGWIPEKYHHVDDKKFQFIHYNIFLLIYFLTCSHQLINLNLFYTKYQLTLMLDR